MDSNTDLFNNKNHNNALGENSEGSIGLHLYYSMKKYGNNVLQYIADTGEIDTYEQVLIRSVRTALRLKEKGIGKNDIISTCTYNHKNSCVPLLATFFIGAIPANFDPNLTCLETIHLLKLVEPKLIFVTTESLPFMEKCLAESKTKTKLVVFGKSLKYEEFTEYLVPHPQEDHFKPASVDDSRETAIILFSSGTTGLPKGICLSHHALIRPEKAPSSTKTKYFVSLSYTKFYWISGLAFLILTINSGDAKVVCSKFDPYKAWEIIEKYKVTWMFLPPHLSNEFLNHRPKDVSISSLKLFITGSFPVTEKLMKDLRSALPDAMVFNGYGQTEAVGAICGFNARNPEEVDMQIRKPLSCGKMMPGFLWKVVDPDSEEILGPNQRGELRIKNDFLMNGYYKMDTSSAYDSEGYLKTGDIVYYDEEDCFYVVDRIKEILKYKSWQILPIILENILMGHPAVKEAAVIGIPHDIDGDHPMGIVVLYDESKNVTPEEIELFVEERVPEIQRLRAGVKIVNKLPRTTTEKTKRSVLKKMVLDGEI